jgi:hypothetical protein
MALAYESRNRTAGTDFVARMPCRITGDRFDSLSTLDFLVVFF